MPCSVKPCVIIPAHVPNASHVPCGKRRAMPQVTPWLVALAGFVAFSGFDSFIGFDSSAQAQNRIELEVIAERSEGIDAAQQWLEVLAESGADDVRLVNARSGTGRAAIREIEGATRKTIRVTGVLMEGRLHLPKGKFTPRQIGQIREYLASLRADGAEVALADKFAFGLTAAQLVKLHDDLARPVGESTRDKTPLALLEALGPQLETPLELDDGARALLAGDYTLTDELEGLSAGTAMAAALRPLGLVLAPQRNQGEAMRIRIVPSHLTEEFWPVGWPPEKSLRETFPKLYEKIPVRIRNYTLASTLPAIARMMESPFLYDANSIAENAIQLDQIRITMEADQMTFLSILSRVFGQSRGMDYEIRVDEAGKPFVWIFAH